jgi:hypothetical protein
MPDKLADMAFDQARRGLRTAWEESLHARGIKVSTTDAFTDGFWAARDWTLERLHDLIPEDKIPEALERLGIERDSPLGTRDSVR